MFPTDPSNRMAKFEDVIEAFKKFSEGGFWIKKVIQRFGLYRETVEGPYTKKEAQEISDRWKKIFKFEGKQVSRVLDFKDLICSESKNLPVDEHLKWKPPKGSGIMCVLENIYPLAIYKQEDLDDPEIKKFYRFTKTQGIKKKKVKDYVIFYNSNNTDSYRRYYALYRLLEDDSFGYEPEQIKWLIANISNKSTEKYDKPKLIPGYIDNLSHECSPIQIDFFKQKLTLHKIFNQMKKCTPEDNRSFFVYREIEFESVEVDLLLETKIMKRLVIEKGSNGKYNILLTNYYGDFSIGVYGIQKGTGQMIIHLPNSHFQELDQDEIFFVSKNLKDRYITKLDINGAVLLYIVKCLGVKKIWLEDNQEDKCVCGASEISSFINPVRFLADQGSIYGNLGFKNKNQKLVDRIVDEYRTYEIPIFTRDNVGMSNGDGSDSEEESQPTFIPGGERVTMELEEMANIYLEKDCMYQNLCDLMKIVTDEIHSRIPNSYELDLEQVELSYYRGYFN